MYGCVFKLFAYIVRAPGTLLMWSLLQYEIHLVHTSNANASTAVTKFTCELTQCKCKCECKCKVWKSLYPLCLYLHLRLHSHCSCEPSFIYMLLWLAGACWRGAWVLHFGVARLHQWLLRMVAGHPQTKWLTFSCEFNLKPIETLVKRIVTMSLKQKCVLR